MESKELRIGNYYIDIDERLSELSGYELYQMNSKQNQNTLCAKEYVPIPLTEEWLLKLGLVYDKDEEATFLVPYSFYIVYEVDDDYCIYENVNDTFITSIEYVHQLQNLYFALCGEELTLKD